MEDSLITLQYNREEYEALEGHVKKIIALCSEKLREEAAETALRLQGPVLSHSMFRSRVGSIRVLKDGYESLLYQTLSEVLIYALEEGYFDPYQKFSGLSLPSIKQSSVVIYSYSRDVNIPRRDINPLLFHTFLENTALLAVHICRTHESE